MISDYPKIPENSFPDTSGIDIVPNNERMISLTSLDTKRITFSKEYYNKFIAGAINQCFFREEVGELLLKALRLLPIGYGLKIYDAWRPFEVQETLYKQLSFENEDRNKDNKFVSIPSRNPFKPFPHSTGGAIDLTITKDNNEIYMGTKFDEFSEISNTNYYEKMHELKKNEYEALHNRRFLYYIMTQVGFTNLPSEWWHFDYGNMFWSYYKKQNAIYEGVFELSYEEK